MIKLIAPLILMVSSFSTAFAADLRLMGGLQLGGGTMTGPMYGVQLDTITQGGKGENLTQIPLVMGNPLELPSSALYSRPYVTIVDNLDGMKVPVVKGGGATCSATFDGVDFIASTESLKITTAGDGAACTAQFKNLSPTVNMANQQLSMYVETDSLDKMNGGTIYLSNDNLTSHFLICDFSGSLSGQSFRYVGVSTGAWIPVTLSLANCTRTGTPDLSKINSFQFRILDKNLGAGTTIHIQSLGTFPEPPKLIVTNSFDNGNYSAISTGAVTMAQYGWRASIYVTPEDIGLSNQWLNISSLTYLANRYGWEIGLHPGGLYYAGGDGGPGVSTGAAQNILFRDLQYLAYNGVQSGVGCAYPHGSFSPAIEAVFKQQCLYARTVITADVTNAQTDIETFPPADPFRIRAYSVTNTDTLTTLQNIINNSTGHPAMVNLVWHDFLNPASNGTDVLPATFQAFMTWLSTQNVVVLPLGEALNQPGPVQVASSMTVISQLNVGGQANPPLPALVINQSSNTADIARFFSAGVAAGKIGPQGHQAYRQYTKVQIDTLIPDFINSHITVTNYTNSTLTGGGTALDCISTGTLVSQWMVAGGTHGVNMNGCGTGQ